MNVGGLGLNQLVLVMSKDISSDLRPLPLAVIAIVVVVVVALSRRQCSGAALPTPYLVRTFVEFQTAMMMVMIMIIIIVAYGTVAILAIRQWVYFVARASTSPTP